MLPDKELGVSLIRLDTDKPNTMIKLFTDTNRFQSEYFGPPATCLDSWIHLYDSGASEVYPTSGESARGQSSARSSHKASNGELVTAYNLLATALEVPNMPITLEDKRIALGGLGLLHDLT